MSGARGANDAAAVLRTPPEGARYERLGRRATFVAVAANPTLGLLVILVKIALAH